MKKLIQLVAMAGALWAGVVADAFAQLDPLLFLKANKPNVLLVVETTDRMQRDADNAYYDPFVYPKAGASWEDKLGVNSTNTNATYRRKYLNLINLDTTSGGDKYRTDRISIRGDREGDNYTYFDATARLFVARTALDRAIRLNQSVARFGLIKTRQLTPQLGTQGNDGPVRDLDTGQQSPTETGTDGAWKITRPTVAASDSSLTTVVDPIYRADGATATVDILALLGKAPHAGGLLPAGRDAYNVVDAPIKFMLDDAKAEADRLIKADANGCRNTVVVLVVGGGEGNLTSVDPAAAASSFKTLGGRRVPIYVIALAPPARDVVQLQAIADNSGGRYFEITKSMIAAVPPGSPVPEVVRAVNAAVQHTFASASDFNIGTTTEYQVTSPIIGTVDLTNAKDMTGAALPNSILTTTNGTVIPQRSNVMLTTGFALPGQTGTPGFPGRLRAFRVYRPEPDSTKVAGYKFVADGTALWLARTPTSAEGARNIFTVLPNGTVVAFTESNASTLEPYLRDVDAADLIRYVRGLPLGAFIDSTPAFLDAPSLDPPPDPDYPKFALDNKERRTIVFVGANDGMMHAIDARTGVEVWAFIPFNLLPKLRALREGLAVDKFRFFVDGSPKVADVKTPTGWRTYLVFGEGPGGTFYQTFDVTLPDLAKTVTQESDNVGALLSYFSAAERGPAFKWSFPRYADFDCTISTTATPYGDISAGASDAEKSVGQTWSDPAVGEVQNQTGNYVVMTGSGFLPYSQQHQANRGDVRAGTTFYVLDAVTGTLLDSKDVGDDGKAEDVDSCAAVNDCTKMKNALQSDPVATGPPNSRFISTAYLGDLDGRLWRFTLTLVGGQAKITGGPSSLWPDSFQPGKGQPIFSSLAVVNIGGTQQYVFFGTGSDLLPTTTGMTTAYQLVGVLDQAGTGSQTFARALSALGSGSEEKVSAYPAVAGDIVFFTTTTFHPDSPCSPPDANVYALTFIGGAAYDSNANGRMDNKDSPLVKTFVAGGRATAPFVSDQHLVLAVGGKVEVIGDPEDFNNGVGQVGVRILSWRDIR